ncbi:MAG: 4-(cytidine 5'-diphospho)-2-C-methyl-D-erythritol kinase [Prevotellaceae bacterium]|nr:4-(cytidine 5'-diphospho)-2-C-methyl-D-erythritol kinase [Prevotellaceae bacterium]
MVLFPRAKINIGLQVIARRPDGFHDINTLFYPLPFCDVLEIVEAKKTSLHVSGLPVEGASDDNLCIKAYRLMQQHHHLPPVAIYLHKMIPTGGGLGGGSSDASHTLRALDALFGLQLTEKSLMSLAATLGSDCAFFIQQKPALAEGRGEILHPASLDLSGYYILLMKPPVHISTADAYAQIKPQKPAQALAQIIHSPITAWRGNVKNDFETTVFTSHPELAGVKAQCYAQGAVYASMSGSGATLFGLFDDENTWQAARQTLPHIIFACKL